MFQGQRGWFCRSVSQDLRQFWGRKVWMRRCSEHPPPSGALAPGYLLGLPYALASTVAEEGVISDAKAADFLFSCDASHPDTLRYSEGHRQGLLGHEEPEVENGSCRPLINSDRKRLESSMFRSWMCGVGEIDNLSPLPFA